MVDTFFDEGVHGQPLGQRRRGRLGTQVSMKKSSEARNSGVERTLVSPAAILIPVGCRNFRRHGMGLHRFRYGFAKKYRFFYGLIHSLVDKDL